MIGKKFKQWYASCKGATAIEYALVACGIAMVICGTVFALGDHLYDFLDDISAGFGW